MRAQYVSVSQSLCQASRRRTFSPRRTATVLLWLPIVAFPLFGPATAQAGPYTEAGIAAADPRFVEWASGVNSLVRGPQNISVVGSSPASFGTAASALGTADGSVVSLGDGGSITLSFAQAIRNGSGADFAVFENGFASGQLDYLELGFVEVSSDGTDFFRFPSVSLTQTATQVGSFGLIDPTNLYDLAGKQLALSGTAFDLQELAGVSPLLDVNQVRYVRVVDVVGSINPLFATHDSQGHIVNDPFPTAFSSGGFDLDAVGVLNAVPEPEAQTLAGVSLLLGLGALAVRKLRRPQRCCAGAGARNTEALTGRTMRRGRVVSATG